MSDEIGKPPFDTLESAVKEAQRRRAEIGEWKIRYSEMQQDLRDWFAGQALSVVASLPGRRPVNERGTIYDCVAEDAYAMADAMLRARTRPEGEKP